MTEGITGLQNCNQDVKEKHSTTILYLTQLKKSHQQCWKTQIKSLSFINRIPEPFTKVQHKNYLFIYIFANIYTYKLNYLSKKNLRGSAPLWNQQHASHQVQIIPVISLTTLAAVSHYSSLLGQTQNEQYLQSSQLNSKYNTFKDSQGDKNLGHHSQTAIFLQQGQQKVHGIQLED